MSLQPCEGVFASDRDVAFCLAVIHMAPVWKQQGLGVQEYWVRGCFGARGAQGLLQSHPGRAMLCQGGLLVGCCLAGFSVSVLPQGSSWHSWMVLSLGWTCCSVELCDELAGQPAPARSPNPYLWALCGPPLSQDALQISLENSSSGRREAETAALGFPSSSAAFFLHRFKQSRLLPRLYFVHVRSVFMQEAQK